MCDPHVETLLYAIQTDESTSYRNPPPLEYDTDTFSLRLSEGVLAARLKQHFSSVESARGAVESFLRAWELDVALRRGPGELLFRYEDASIIDRNPNSSDTPETFHISAKLAATASATATVHVARGRYPKPPEYFQASPDVETLWHRYQGYLCDREPLLAMAYFCLSFIEWKAGGRRQAAKQFAISTEVLGKLGEITSTRGDTSTARKLDRKNPLQAITGGERAWVEAVVKALIRRLGEASAAANSLPMLNMADLPSL